MTILISIFFAAFAMAKPVVLVSYFDAFKGASFNNSEKIARALEENMAVPNSTVTIKLCALNTVFERAYGQLETCMKNLDEKPVMVLGLGESTCQLKLETMARNKDKTINGPDNAGEERNNTAIVPGGPKVLGLRFPAPQMYCALSLQERTAMMISNNAGSFVCNNMAFQMTHYYPEIQFGFIHIPANRCQPLARPTEDSIRMLMKMIPAAVVHLEGPGPHDLPHASNEVRLPVTKNGIRELRSKYKNESCIRDYFSRSTPFDDGFWNFNSMMN